MPLYEYECSSHGHFERLRGFAQASQSAPCPTCRRPADRVLSLPTLRSMAPLNRMAAERNERSRHEPRVSTRGCRHTSHESSATGSKSSQREAKRVAAGEPVKPKRHVYTGPRPWVVEHR